jgi:hypothetical protein
MDMNPGTDSLRVNSGAPQSEQQLRIVRLPMPARTEYVFGVPVISVSDTRTTTPEAKGAPLECWQSRQWQLSIATGARAYIANRSACTPAGEWSNHVAVTLCRLAFDMGGRPQATKPAVGCPLNGGTRRPRRWRKSILSGYPDFKGPATLYVLRMMPDGNAFVLTSSNERGGVPSAKKRFPVPNRTG